MRAPPHVVYAHAKYMWACGERNESLGFLRQFASDLSNDLQSENPDRAPRTGVPKQKFDELSRLLARCYFKQAEWERALNADWYTVRRSRYRTVSSKLQYNFSGMLPKSFAITFGLPTMIQVGTRPGIPGLSPILKSLAISKVKVRTKHPTFLERRLRPTSYKQLKVCTMKYFQITIASFFGLGFFRSISLRNENALQDTLRLLTLWFKYGAHDEVSQAMATGFTNVEVDTWLEVIPQACVGIDSVCTNSDSVTDNRSCSNTQCQHSAWHQQLVNRSW
jgi:serine/threonine-protein kinase mTOR